MQDVKSVIWHPSGELLVSTSYDDSIKLWVDSDDDWFCAQTLEGEDPSTIAWVFKVSMKHNICKARILYHLRTSKIGVKLSKDIHSLKYCTDTHNQTILYACCATMMSPPKYFLCAVYPGVYRHASSDPCGVASIVHQPSQQAQLQLFLSCSTPSIQSDFSLKLCVPEHETANNLTPYDPWPSICAPGLLALQDRLFSYSRRDWVLQRI